MGAMSLKFLSRLFCLAGALLCFSLGVAKAWEPKQGPMMTKWAKLVNPQKPLTDYPRPQLVQADTYGLCSREYPFDYYVGDL